MTESKDYEAEHKARKARFKIIEKEVEKEKFDATGHEIYFKELKEKNKDSYGKAIVDYAELWGKIMQVEMRKNKGRLTEKMIKDADAIADDRWGLSGYMYNTAKVILASCWKYGFRFAAKTKMFGTSKPKWLMTVIKNRRETTDYKYTQAKQKEKAAQPHKKEKGGRE